MYPTERVISPKPFSPPSPFGRAPAKPDNKAQSRTKPEVGSAHRGLLSYPGGQFR